MCRCIAMAFAAPQASCAARDRCACCVRRTVCGACADRTVCAARTCPHLPSLRPYVQRTASAPSAPPAPLAPRPPVPCPRHVRWLGCGSRPDRNFRCPCVESLSIITANLYLEISLDISPFVFVDSLFKIVNSSLCLVNESTSMIV